MMSYKTKAILKYAVTVPVSLILSLLNYPLAPVVVLFAGDDGWLPNWLRWFQTPDNSLDGDEGWKKEHRWFYRGQETNGKGWKRWINRFRWLWRNSMHGFEREILGFTPELGFYYEYRGNQKVSNRPLCEGLVVRWVQNQNETGAFQWYFVWRWPFLKSKCVRINLGWKLWQNPKSGKFCQHVVSISPWMGCD